MSKQSAPPICKHPDHITSYFSMQKGILAVITVSGLIYNLGLMARPWFEGQMIQCLFFIQKGQSHFSDMLKLASAYFIAIFTVQISRFIKRLYVRRFANNINRSMMLMCGKVTHKNLIDSLHYSEKLTKKKQN